MGHSPPFLFQTLAAFLWAFYEESFGLLNVTRSVWRSTVADPKTEKSKAAVPVIPQLAQRLEAHRKRCGNPAGGPIFVNTVGHPLDLNACYQKEMKDPLKRAGICGMDGMGSAGAWRI